MTSGTISQALSREDFDKIKLFGIPRTYKEGDVIFSDGDHADYIYFIESGNVSIFIEKFTHQEEINMLGPGDYFGEMAFFSGDKRSASASAKIDTMLISVDKNSFLNLFESDQEIADKINRVFTHRDRELSFKEHLVGSMGNTAGSSFQLGIKGDPSLRFSAFSRERYDSVVDRIMPDLQPRLYDLLLNRSPYEIFIHCNSGEVHVRTVFDPFNGEIHPATKLLNIAYIERQFPLVNYETKTELIRSTYQAIRNHPGFAALHERFREELQSGFSRWKPVPPQTIAGTISKLTLLRKIPNFYLRNFTISTVRDIIRMQFNCDGTQIVNAEGFHSFLEQNLDEDEVNTAPAEERRIAQRRDHAPPVTGSRFQHGERRSPPGRRQKDWDSLLETD